MSIHYLSINPPLTDIKDVRYRTIYFVFKVTAIRIEDGQKVVMGVKDNVMDFKILVKKVLNDKRFDNIHIRICKNKRDYRNPHIVKTIKQGFV